MNNITCPACGSTNVKTNTETESIKEAFGGKEEIDITIHTCEICGTNGDFLDKNDKEIQKGIDLLKDKAVENILEDFLGMQYNFAALERALEIPQRTFSRWKNKTTKPSAPSIALLKFLRLFPWLIEVAEQKYDYSKAQRINMLDALSRFVGQMTFNDDFSGLDTTTTLEFLQLKISTSSEPPQADDNKMNFGYTSPEMEANVISEGTT